MTFLALSSLYVIRSYRYARIISDGTLFYKLRAPSYLTEALLYRQRKPLQEVY